MSFLGPFLGIGGFIFVVLLLIAFFYFIPIQLWVTALASRVRVSLLSLIGMRLRKIAPSLIVNALINARKAGLQVTSELLETHYLAGGNVKRVVDALIAADKAGIDLDFKLATAIDLAGRNVLEAVQTSVNPKVIDSPKEGKISAVAIDGIQLNASARVTVRA
ncbi:MAG: flotillin-like FloA family protein, partial [Calditrichaeota bacterium]|nr:flotillin-like FloA family protein [Calditrichota bacterium]